VKVVGVRDTNLEDCVRQAQREQVVLTRRGKPVAVLVGVRGLDLEQAELGTSDAFWTLIRERRRQRTLTRAELDERLAGP
jgi:prevent-host-death family protein